MPVYQVDSYQITLWNFGVFTTPVIELDASGMEDAVVIRHDIPDFHGGGLYAVHQPGNGLLGCHALRSDYERHVDLLRHERPVYFKVSPPGYSFEGSVYSDLEGHQLIWALATTTEPLGEGPIDDSVAQDQVYRAFQGYKYGLVNEELTQAPRRDD